MEISHDGTPVKGKWEYRPSQSILTFRAEPSIKHIQTHQKNLEELFPTAITLGTVSPTYKQTWDFISYITKNPDNVRLAKENQRLDEFPSGSGPRPPVTKAHSGEKYEVKRIRYETASLLKIPVEGKLREELIMRFVKIMVQD